MYRKQDVYHSSQAPNYSRTPDTRPRRVYPRERPVHWGLYEVLSSALFIALSLMFVAGIAALVLQIVGFDSLTQLYGFDRMIEFDI